MTASEQQAEYADARTLAHSVTDSVSPELRAAIEADVLRRVADGANADTLHHVVWEVQYLDFGGVSSRDAWAIVTALQDHLRAEADRIEEGVR